MQLRTPSHEQRRPNDPSASDQPGVPPAGGLLMTGEGVRAGDVIAGRYDLAGLLGSGGWGQVWKAHDRVLQRDVAIKVVRDDRTGGHFRRLFEREARYGGMLSSNPHVASVYHYDVDTSRPDRPLQFLVMELLSGGSLEDWLGAAPHGPPPVRETLDILAQAATGLAAAHDAGVIHRDVKPSNLMFGSDGVLKVTDFGVAIADDDTRVNTDQIVGTPGYRAPEQERHEETKASDVYSLGVVGYQCLSGKVPSAGSSPAIPGVPEPVQALLTRALTADPQDRYPDARAFRDAVSSVQRALEAAEDRHATTPNVLHWDPPPPTPVPRRPTAVSGPGKNRRIAVIIGALLMAVVLGMVLSTVVFGGGGGGEAAGGSSSTLSTTTPSTTTPSTTTPSATTPSATTPSTTTTPRTTTTTQLPPTTYTIPLAQWGLCCGSRYNVAGEPFTSVLAMEDNETEIENSTCTSLTMRAGIWDLSHEQNPEIPTNAVTVQGEAGTGWGQTWSVTAGAAVQDHTFTLQPGLVQIAVSDGLVVLINGEVTCATPDGRLP